jgi:mRNA-degrading endonuclease RelE of RelBE toxin-antitoxin system
MKNKVITTPFFESKYKRLAKKFPSLRIDLQKLEKELILNPKLGSPLGGSLSKIKISK